MAQATNPPKNATSPTFARIIYDGISDGILGTFVNDFNDCESWRPSHGASGFHRPFARVVGLVEQPVPVVEQVAARVPRQ